MAMLKNDSNNKIFINNIILFIIFCIAIIANMISGQCYKLFVLLPILITGFFVLLTSSCIYFIAVTDNNLSITLHNINPDRPE